MFKACMCTSKVMTATTGHCKISKTVFQIQKYLVSISVVSLPPMSPTSGCWDKAAVTADAGLSGCLLMPVETAANLAGALGPLAHQKLFSCYRATSPKVIFFSLLTLAKRNLNWAQESWKCHAKSWNQEKAVLVSPPFSRGQYLLQ